ncbi:MULTISPECIES: FAD-binding protein [Legionella]|uniref:Putative decaprenylphosphoryl-beta-D-ribose oxidase n=1 Tax=Legionella drozanskii LLAP-1 TaxID=1212489 RepID=A0A0W0ST44_9GAMM|nr:MULTISPECIES: FAD-binding protein [Legionella]KTC86133.1 putative decaprenylphosphoryl-beta-D-ribose oxidase [Legionella drozanskii LLAP-1]PJE17707.1 MAG: hypothetical protein CK430_01955 [Legionella sp.]
MSKLKEMFNSLPELGRLNSWPAGMIDRAYLANSKGFFSKAWQFFKVRAIFLTLFLPLTLVDILVSGALGIRFSFSTFFVADNLQDQRLAQQKKYTTIFSKNLYAIFASLIGLISPKLVAFYFTPEKTSQKGVTAGGGYHHDEEAEFERPTTVRELQSIITEAAEAGKKVMPIGAGLSQGKQFLPEGGKGAVVVDLSQLQLRGGPISIDAEEGVATVSAAVRWADLQNEANKLGLALQFMQASNVFSVGGSIGTDIHGWNITGTLADSILEIDFVDAQGKQHTLTPEDELFHHLTSGFGLYGVITQVKLKLIKNEKLYERGVEVAPAQYVEHFQQKVQHNDNVHMHLYRLSLDPKNLLGAGVAVDYVKDPSPYGPVEDEAHKARLEKGKQKDDSVEKEEELRPRSKRKERIKEEEDEICVTPNLQQEGNRGTRFNQVMINLARRIPYVRKYYWESERDRVLANNAPATTTNEIMQPPINAMFNPSVSEAEWLQEYFLPGDELDGFLAELGQLLMTNGVPLLNASVRFVKHNQETHQSPLSYARAGDRFAVVLCFNQSLEPSEIIKAKKWLREAQHMAVERGGSYYLPYQQVSSPDDFDRAYPDAQAKVQALKQEVDPEGVFSSGLYQKYLAPQTEVNHFKVIMESEENKEEFAGFLKNVLQRVDADKFFALLEDIMTYNDTHAEIYQELCNRLPEIMPSAIGDFRHILSSLSAIKTDLARQAKAILPSEMTEINGLVEIGYPARFVGGFKANYQVTGPIVAIHENDPSLTDYIQTGYPRPNDDYRKLDYNKPHLALADLPEDSADVITCYVGLHHFPDDELEAFLTEVRRVLREGGHFLLVDHDVEYGETSMSMAHMAHTVFNAVTGASLKEEMTERRNFRPMSHWKALLEEYGLGYEVEGPDVPMIREGDPSRNRMVSFVKPKLELQLDKGLSSSANDKDDYEHGPHAKRDFRKEKQIKVVVVEESTASNSKKTAVTVKKDEDHQDKHEGEKVPVEVGQWRNSESSAKLSRDGHWGAASKRSITSDQRTQEPTPVSTATC